MNISNKRRLRNQKGQAIVEGTVVLWLITFLFVAGVLLIMFTGISLYYRMKMGFVAQQIAAFMQNRANFIGVPRPIGTGPGQFDLVGTTAQAKDFGNTLLSKFGLPPVSDDNIVISQPASGSSIWEVTVKEDKLSMPGGGMFFPSIISMQETGLSIENTQDLFAYAEITVQDPKLGNARGMVVPVMAYTLQNTDYDEASNLSCKFGFGNSMYGAFTVNGELEPTSASGSLYYNKGVGTASLHE